MARPNFQTCLGIPTPESLRALVRAPPLCLPTPGDVAAVKITGGLGKDLSRPADEVTQGESLADGLSDIVIILQRPLNRSKHNPKVSFHDFVEDSRTLSAVKELIHFASKGARSIYTVTVLNAFPFQHEACSKDQAKKGHEAITQVLKVKKPKVILRCHCEEYSDEWLKRLELPGREYQLERKEVKITEDHTAVVLQSFHPSCAVNNADCRPEYRALLMYHFVAAFSELTSEFSLPDTAEKIRKLCLKKGERMWYDIPDYKPWQAAFRISEALENTQVEGFNATYESLSRLAGGSSSFGCLGIAKIVLFLWKRHFREDPLYEQVMSWLLSRGNEQKDWFPCEPPRASHRRSLEDYLSDLQISERPVICDIQRMTYEASLLAVQASETLRSAENLGEDLRAKMIDIYEKYNALVCKYLSGSSMSETKDAIPIRAQLKSCEVFLSTFSDQEYMLGLVRCHKQLASLVGANGVA
ncbi:hypothetical protein N7523_005896 [Penicillium sp. IBT 18751x]|nr:hypothetical protein N7523_005896 [Penicillium sp. IBT 18751x]